MTVDVLKELCAGAGIEPLRYFSCPGRPIAKGRPRFGKGGNVYTPAATVTAERGLKLLFAATSKGEPIAGPVALAIVFYVPSKGQRGDIDNMIKTVMDAGNKAAWNDDRQVVRQTAMVRVDAAAPRTLVAWCLLAEPAAAHSVSAPLTQRSA